MFTKAAVVSAFAGLTVAAPWYPTPTSSHAPTTTPTTNPNVFAAIINRSGSPIQGFGINAKDGNFNVNNGTSTFCPSGQIDCSKAGNITVFAYNPDSQTLALDVVVPGGQQVFVRKDGSLGFSVAHSGAIPDRAMTHPFQFTPQSREGTVGQLKFATRSFNACKTGEKGPSGLDVYQLYSLSIGSQAQLEKECLEVGFSTATWPGAIAYEYV